MDKTLPWFGAAFMCYVIGNALPHDGNRWVTVLTTVASLVLMSVGIYKDFPTNRKLWLITGGCVLFLLVCLLIARLSLWFGEGR